MSDNLAKIRRLRAVAELVYNQELLTKVGLAYESVVRKRTRAGLDIHGKAFQPYSPAYEGVRSRSGEPTHPVNLTMDHFTGMLASVDHVVFNDLSSVMAFVEGSRKRGKKTVTNAQIGRYHAIDGAGKSKVIRKWWGLSDKELKDIEDLIELELDKIFTANL